MNFISVQTRVDMVIYLTPVFSYFLPDEYYTEYHEGNICNLLSSGRRDSRGPVLYTSGLSYQVDVHYLQFKKSKYEASRLPIPPPTTQIYSMKNLLDNLRWLPN